MKKMKIIILSGFLLLLSLLSFGQSTKESKGFLKFGTGVYLDISRLSNYKTSKDENTGLLLQAVVPGKTIWIEGGYNFNNGLFVSAGVMYELTKRKRTDIYYPGQKELYFEENYSLNIGYEFNLGKGNRFMPALGVLYNRRTTSHATFYSDINNSIHPVLINNIDSEIGLNLLLDYYYQFNNKLFLGVRAGVYYVLGWEGVTLTPVFGVKF